MCLNETTLEPIELSRDYPGSCDRSCSGQHCGDTTAVSVFDSEDYPVPFRGCEDIFERNRWAASVPDDTKMKIMLDNTEEDIECNYKERRICQAAMVSQYEGQFNLTEDGTNRDLSLGEALVQKWYVTGSQALPSQLVVEMVFAKPMLVRHLFTAWQVTKFECALTADDAYMDLTVANGDLWTAAAANNGSAADFLTLPSPKTVTKMKVTLAKQPEQDNPFFDVRGCEFEAGDPPSTDPTAGYVFDTHNGFVYMIPKTDTVSSYADAKAYCETRGSHLAPLDTHVKWELVKNLSTTLHPTPASNDFVFGNQDWLYLICRTCIIFASNRSLS